MGTVSETLNNEMTSSFGNSQDLNSLGYTKITSFQLMDSREQTLVLFYSREEESLPIPYIIQIVSLSRSDFQSAESTFSEYFAIQVNELNEVTDISRVFPNFFDNKIEIWDSIRSNSLIGERIPSLGEMLLNC